MRYLKRLSDHATFTGILPWEFTPETPLPEEVRVDKKARTRWINDPKTNHHVYTLVEGVNANLRVSKPKADGEGNPAYKLHGLVADYDSPAPEETVLKHASELPYPPQWIEKTLSGNWRYVWLFEEPIRFASFSFAVHFLKTFEVFAFDPARGMVGFDRPAWEAPERLWTNGCDWRGSGVPPISADITRGWLAKASEKFEFSEREFGPGIPLDEVATALAVKYPTFSEWPGEFKEGSHGPTFWVPASRSPMSATVYPNGLRTFSENAHKTFFSWAELLGIDFVKKYQAESIGKATAGIFYDGRSYWRQFSDGAWRPEEQQILARHLVVHRGVSKKGAKDEPITELDRALDFIANEQRVDVALPTIYRPHGLWIGQNGRRHLNTSTVQVIPPADGVATWGPDGQFPWLSQFLDNLFDPVQTRVLLAWAAWGYQWAYRHQPRSGQILFIAGPVNMGKTLLNRAILGRVFGGVAEAGKWLMGETDFNGDLFNVGFWVIDDSDASSDPAKRRTWSHALKRVAANREFRCNEKFRAAGLTEWVGRVCVTMNADEESVRLLPDLDVSNLDKSIILRTKSTRSHPFPSNLTEILDRELPFFARFLADYQIPEENRGDTRFGVKEYHEPSMLDTARQSSQQSGFSELLEDWRREYAVDHPKETFWEGTALQLFIELGRDPGRARATAKTSADSVGRHLSALKNKGTTWVEIRPRTTTRCWRIYFGENLDS